MKLAAVALAVGTMLTVEQRDANRSNLDRSSSAVSADGRFVAFITYSQLAPADRDSSSDVYVLDRARQHVTLESTNRGHDNSDSAHPGISGDGRYVVFEQGEVVVLRDRKDGVTTVLGSARQPTIAASGRVVLFTASSFDGATGVDANGAGSDIYTVDLRTGQARRISVGMKGLDPSVAASVTPSVSDDGRYVAFASRLKTEGGRPPVSQVFVRDTMLDITRAVGAGWDPSLSGDGRVVAFTGYSSKLPHIFVADLQTGTTQIITKSTRRGLANGASVKSSVSADGRFVAFQSEASDLVTEEDFNLLWDVFVFDRRTGAITRVSGDSEGGWMEPSSGPSIDATGSVVAFSSRHPTDASDKRNDFDLYVATVGGGRLVVGGATNQQPPTTTQKLLPSLLYLLH